MKYTTLKSTGQIFLCSEIKSGDATSINSSVTGVFFFLVEKSASSSGKVSAKVETASERRNGQVFFLAAFCREPILPTANQSVSR